MPTTKSIDDLFAFAVKQGASDLHLLTDQPPLIRIDGRLAPIEGAKRLTATQCEDLIVSILTQKQIDELQRTRELDCSYELTGVSRFRVNIHYQQDTLGLVARIISSKIPSMAELDMPSVVEDFIRLDQGLVLVTGPTGMGKSTSLAAMIQQINLERNAHIITLEDPIEFVYEAKKSVVRQRQLGTDMTSFAEGLKHVLRQDPNVILVGEMRDLETISATITLAETGHLVLATLHTSNSSQTIDRIIDVFPPYQQPQVRLQVSLFLRGIVSQLLVPKVGGGRIAAREILINTPAIGNLIRENKIAQIKNALQTGAEIGMVTLDQDLKRLVEEEKITRDTALSHVSSPTALR